MMDQKDLLVERWQEALAQIGRPREKLGRMRLGKGTVLALWGLRLYVIAMLGLIGAKFVGGLAM